MKGEATKWCDDHLPGLRKAILHERIDSYRQGRAAGRAEVAQEAAALVPWQKSLLAGRIRPMKESIPGVDGGERHVCDGCGRHEGPVKSDSPTGVELVTSLTFSAGEFLFKVGDWHETCFRQALTGGWTSFFHETLMDAADRHAVDQDMPSVETMAKEALEMNRPTNVPGKALKSQDDIVAEVCKTDTLGESSPQVVSAGVRAALSYVPNWWPLLLFAVKVRDNGPMEDLGVESPETCMSWTHNIRKEAEQLLTQYEKKKGES